MKTTICLLIAIVFLVSCATGKVTFKITDEGAEIQGNAAGRTASYTKTETKKDGTVSVVSVTVEDQRTPNPAKGLVDFVGNFFKAMWSKADVAIPI